MRLAFMPAVWLSLACTVLGQELPLSKKVTVKYENLPVAEALRDLGEKSGVRFTFEARLFEGADHVTFVARDQEAGRVAARLLGPRGFKLEQAEGAQVAVARRDPHDEFKVKTEALFEFAEKPKVTRNGDRVTIAFAAKGWCDATVAIEDASGKIIRHLASGVLGANAPEPFQWNSKQQTLVWDGKDDQDVYVDAKDAITVRVSLGLKPQFERTLFWSPHKRLGSAYPVLCAGPEGMFVAETYCLDHGTHGGTQLLLFDHDGNYQRTVYPFPSSKLGAVRGLAMHTTAAAGISAPLKQGYYGATLLPIGSIRFDDGKGGHQIFAGGLADTSGSAYRGPAFAVRDGALALCYGNLARLNADGSSGGLELVGPRTSIDIPAGAWLHAPEVACPISGALSPDRKWLYLAGYQFTGTSPRNRSWLCGVTRVPYDGSGGMTLFAGTLKPGEENGGTADGQFRVAPSVACDAQGRVYAADYMNDRIQVFAADGKHLKSIPAKKPASVAVHQKNGDIYVFSWLLVNRLITSGETRVDATFTHLGPFEDPQVKASGPLPLIGHSPVVGWNAVGGVQHRVGLDSWTEPPTLWVINGLSSVTSYSDDGSFRGKAAVGDSGSGWEASAFTLYREREGKLMPVRRFIDEVKKSVVRPEAPPYWRQRLYVNPANGKCYLGEPDSGVDNSFNQLVELDPRSGKVQLVNLPLGAEDLVFDQQGLAYIRTDTVVARYDSATWREIPWNYGEELTKHSYGMGAKEADLLSGLITPGHRSHNFWHLGGIDISVKGHLLVTTCNLIGVREQPKAQHGEPRFNYEGRRYEPGIYPGRNRWGELHIWDKHGKVVMQDVVPGIGHLNGVGIDRDDNIYLLSASRRVIGGKPYEPKLERDATGTLLKVAAGKSKTLSAGDGVPVPLSADSKPKRSLDLGGHGSYNHGWVEGAEWFYGGAGFCTPAGCICVNCRFDLDYFNRSFTSEPQLFSVAVLDSSGNLILRVGRYGNVQDGKPLIADGGPAETRSIGGDEVGLFHACFVATDTDRRLFIADQGNARILSVKLGYHAEEKIALKDVPDQVKK